MGTKAYHKEKSREHYLKNKEDYLERGRVKRAKPDWNSRKRNYREANKIWLVEHFGGECKHCKGKFSHHAFEFHHTHPEKKNLNLSKTAGHYHKLESFKEKIKDEIPLVIMLCSNCHRIEHGEHQSEFNVLKREIENSKGRRWLE